MDGDIDDSMDGINPGEQSITMDFIHPVIGKDIQSDPKKWKLIL